MLEGQTLLAWNVKPPALLGTWRSSSGWLCGSAFVMSGDRPCTQDSLYRLEFAGNMEALR